MVFKQKDAKNVIELNKLSLITLYQNINDISKTLHSNAG